MTSPVDAGGRVPVRPGLEDVEPYGAPQLDVAVRLNTNETATPPPPGFLDRVTERLRSVDLNRYPDRDHVELRAALAARHAVDRSAVWAANGSNEVLIQLLQAYGGPGRTALSLRPSYSMYPELCRTALTPMVAVDLDDSLEVDTDAVIAAVGEHRPDLVLFASPNNPTGTPIPREVVREVHDATPGLVVVDEAYVEFAPTDTSVVDLVATLPRLVVVRTFSKAFRLAGLRLGYLVASPWVVEDLQKVRLPYHLDAITQVAGIVALEDEESFLEHRAQVAAERERLVVRLVERPGTEVFASVANFVLVRTDVDDLFGRLLEHGVLVRDFSTRPRLSGCVRVTIGTPEENDAFIRALDMVRADA